MERVSADGFNYQAEADKTCSIEWRPQQVSREAFLANLRAFVELGGVLNLYKKLLFRGKTPADLGMSEPLEPASLLGFVAESDIDLVHGLLGIATEAGEAVEILADLLDGKRPDRVNAVEECGDLRWYENRVLRWAGVTDEQCERANIAKLHGRGFAAGFDMFADSNRDLDAERAILAAGVEGEYHDPATMPSGPHGDEALIEDLIEYGYRRGPIGDCEGMDC